ncbi:MAG: hypothetical protein AAGC68_06650 [Verrucomicrobiota bacterium]
MPASPRRLPRRGTEDALITAASVNADGATFFIEVKLIVNGYILVGTKSREVMIYFKVFRRKEWILGLGIG